METNPAADRKNLEVGFGPDTLGELVIVVLQRILQNQWAVAPTYHECSVICRVAQYLFGDMNSSRLSFSVIFQGYFLNAKNTRAGVFD